MSRVAPGYDRALRALARHARRLRREAWDYEGGMRLASEERDAARAALLELAKAVDFDGDVFDGAALLRAAPAPPAPAKASRLMVSRNRAARRFARKPEGPQKAASDLERVLGPLCRICKQRHWNPKHCGL